jgi:hypothetical protein
MKVVERIAVGESDVIVSNTPLYGVRIYLPICDRDKPFIHHFLTHNGVEVPFPSFYFGIWQFTKVW